MEYDIYKHIKSKQELLKYDPSISVSMNKAEIIRWYQLYHDFWKSRNVDIIIKRLDIKTNDIDNFLRKMGINTNDRFTIELKTKDDNK